MYFYLWHMLSKRRWIAVLLLDLGVPRDGNQKTGIFQKKKNSPKFSKSQPAASNVHYRLERFLMVRVTNGRRLEIKLTNVAAFKLCFKPLAKAGCQLFPH